LHRTRLAKLELLHASRIATFGLLGLALLVVSLNSMLGGLALSITVDGTDYRYVLELVPVWNISLLVAGIASVLVVIASLLRMERAQDRIIEMKLKSDEEADEILKYHYEDYRKEHDLRFAISPVIMVIALVISGLALDIWLNEVILPTQASASLFLLGVGLGCLSLIDQLLLWRKTKKAWRRDKE
jgi:hypothetical protein